MSKKQQDDIQAETNQEDSGDNQTEAEKPKMTPLEAVKARRAAMQQSKGGQGQRANSGSEGTGTGGPTKRPNLQRKMG